MHKRTAQLFGLTALLICATAAMAGTVTVSFVNGTQNNTTALTGFSTFGDMMSGMKVTVTFLDSSTATATWATTGVGAGGASGSNWSLVESGDTFGSLWTLRNSTGSGIQSVGIDAGPGDTVFDTTFNGNFGTNGSFSGTTFGVVSGLGSLDIGATYMNCVALTGNPCVGDLFRNLNIDFNNTGGFGSGSQLQFIADTDNIEFAGDITPIPEPATIVLLGTGLAGLMARRFKK